MMLRTISVVLIALWVFGLVSSYTMDGLIHIFLVLAFMVILLNIIQDQKVM
ncbi:MAG: lmo0937 family membrane protein [Anaerolineales bacterium]|nr:lmo0937 family membrane protein [Anaerolineales bacterium]